MTARSAALPPRFVGSVGPLARLPSAVLAALGVVVGGGVGAQTQLPVPCAAASCGTNAAGWVTAGAASAAIAGDTLTVTQTSRDAVLNWQSFDISTDGVVDFKQPDAAAVAINRVFDNRNLPSTILGALKANGRVFLINQNGILFGEGASVDVGGLLASTLNITPEALRDGIAGAARSRRPAFEAFRDNAGQKETSGPIVIERGAELRSDGGQILVFAPEVVNEGTIRTPDGQTVLAAGDSVFLVADPALRGLLVEVGVGGTVTNGAATNAGAASADVVGRIVAERGNVTLAGMAVNQLGRVSASTSVRSGGSIRLLARDDARIASVGEGVEISAGRGGILTVGPGSSTVVTLDNDDATEVDVNVQPQSLVELEGKRVNVLENATVAATGGRIVATARLSTQTPLEQFEPIANDSRIYVAAGATLDVAGATLELPMERNVVRAELRANELRDSPEQRDGALRGKAVFVDVRRSGVREDGSAWQGTPLADVSGAIATVGKDVRERNSSGGSIELRSQGDAILAPGSTLNVAGGSISYGSGQVNTTQLVGADGRLYDISAADPNREYVGIANTLVVEHRRWGVTETFQVLQGVRGGRQEQGYVEGKDAGAIEVLAPRAILDGAVVGSTTQGPFQRLPSDRAAEGPRRFDQIPLGARLTLGNANANPTTGLPNFLLGNVLFTSGTVLPGLRRSDGTAFEPSSDSLPDSVLHTRVRPELLGSQSVSEVRVFSNDRIAVPGATALSLPAGGALELKARQLDVAGSVTAPGGTISLHSQPTIVPNGSEVELALRSTARLDARGLWVNDAPVRTGTVATTPLFIDGGTVAIASEQGGMSLEAGSVVDVSAGAWQRPDGRIAAGHAGEISLSAESPPSVLVDAPFVLESTLRGFALYQGGRIDLSANEICIASTDCSDVDPSTVWLAPRFFVDNGFESFALTSNRRGLTVAPNTTITLLQQNFRIDGSPWLVPSAIGLDGFASVGTLDPVLRRPTQATLATNENRGSIDFDASLFAATQGLTVGRGAAILGDVGSALALRSNSTLLIDGRLSAPAGNISIDLTSSLRIAPGQFFGNQGIWLGANASLDAQGATRLIRDDRGLLIGEVLHGGAVAIRAQRGYVVLLDGSSIDVSGTAADIDIRQGFGAGVGDRTLRQRVASNGGRIALTAAEGVLTGGELKARAGDGPGAAGGRLEIALDPEQRLDPGVTIPSFPTGTRRITVSAERAPLQIAPRTAVPSALNGRAYLGSDTVRQGGFSELSLTARNLLRSSVGTELSTGEIAFDGAIDLALGGRIELYAARLSGIGGDVRVAAPYVAIGSRDRLSLARPAASPTIGEHAFRVAAGLLEVMGHSDITGFGAVELASHGDIRLRGIQRIDRRDLTGSLRSGGDLTLIADQIYGTTLTRFDIEVVSRPSESPPATIRVERSGSGTPVLSAGSVFGLTATNIDQHGVLRAPLGTINLTADRLTLGDGSVTSTVADGVAIPFGVTQGGFDWAYELENSQTLVFGPEQNAAPAQSIALTAQDLDLRAGATIDVSGGGDLLAYEFVPGVGGSRDVLANDARPNQFAVVPGLALSYAPFDQREYRGSSLRPGDSVYLSGVAGLPAGTYALLPARYALLPGAFLVTAVDGYGDIAAGERFELLDGRTVISGYRTVADTVFRDARTSGFAVIRGADARREAAYSTTLGTEFFAALAARTNTIVPRLPVDAGVLSLTAGRSLALDGSLLAAGARGGRGAALDVSADRLRITDGDAIGAVRAGEVVLSDADLAALGAESLILGGKRRQTATGRRIDVASFEVTLDPNATISGPEVIVAARDTVRVSAGAVLSASGTLDGGDETLTLSADGALVRVASGSQVNVDRLGSGAVGSLQIDDGAQILAPEGAVSLDASRDMRVDGRLDVSGGSLSVSSSRISIGDVVGTPQGVVLVASELAGLGLDELVLSSRSTVDLYGAVDLSVNGLVIAAAALRSGIPGGTARLAATGSLTLGNRNGVASVGTGGTSGEITLAAGDVRLEAGRFGIEGFATTTVAADAITFDGEGSLEVGGDLALVAARIGAESGASRNVVARGAVTIEAGAATASDTASADDPPLGARLSISGDRVVHSGRIDLQAGVVELEAMGDDVDDDVVLASGAVIDVGGVMTTFDGVAANAHGGTVRLDARRGSVRVADGATIDVSAAAEGGNAGVVAIAAGGVVDLKGSLRADGAATTSGGTFVLDAASFGSLDVLTTALAAGGFDESIRVRQRGNGDVVVGAASTLRARTVALVADAGSVVVDGLIDARGPDGGKVELAARDDVRVSGQIDAAATSTTGRGGALAIQAVSGGVLVDGTARIDVGGGQGADQDASRAGEVTVRLPRASIATLLDGDTTNDRLTLAGSILGSGRTIVEGSAVYDVMSGIIGAAETSAAAANLWYREAETFAADGMAVLAALGRVDDPTTSVRPGIELRSTADLTLAADWNLAAWRFEGQPGLLTLRAAGNLLFERSLSDGFASVRDVGAFTLPAVPGESWTYRLIAGADTSSADVLQTRRLAEIGAGAGSVRIAAGLPSFDPSSPADFRMIRTGTGDITIRAARDFLLGNQASVVYTAGVAGPGVPLFGTGGLGGLAYPTSGGDISISVGGDVRGAASNQLITDWLWRTGLPVGASQSPMATAWTVNFERFEQGIGALAGGNVDIAAGGDVTLLSVSIPSIGRQVGGNRPSSSRVQVTGGGDLSVRAGGSIEGGSYYAGLGRMILSAAEDIGEAESDFGVSLAPVLALGDGRIDVVARRGAMIETIVNPTLLPQGLSQASFSDFLDSTYFTTYTPNSTVALTTAAGDVRFVNQPSRLLSAYTSIVFGSDTEVGLKVYPPSLRATALRGNVEVGGSLTLFPAPKGNLELLAWNDVRADAPGGLDIFLSDADPAYLPSIDAPQTFFARPFEVLRAPLVSSPNLFAARPVHADGSQTDGVPDLAPARVVAKRGDVVVSPDTLNDQSGFFFSKPARVVAGRDIRDITLFAQHTRETDVTSLIAGRDLAYTIERNTNGRILRNTREIAVDGPGHLELRAGRQVDFQTSSGAVTRGNLRNPALPADGASISVTVGIGQDGVDYDTFIAKYIDASAGGYGDAAAEFVRARTGTPTLTRAEALARFRTLDESVQAIFIERVLFDELRASGRAAAASGSGDFTRGFAALEALFPGSNPDPDGGEGNPYGGDIDLVFSRVYTLDGGSISLLAPGGEINVGLATPPAALGVTKRSEELGVVAQSVGDVSALSYRDFLVNESRVFAADGGDILVWSTDGDIDAGRGAKTAISAPPPAITFDTNGNPQVTFPAALTGSGIQTIAASPGRKPGDVDLFAPRGVVNAGDAGIVAGNLTIAATAVLGADNISVSGVSVGVPVDTGGLAASLTGVSAVASSASNAAEDTALAQRPNREGDTPLADQALGFLDVFVTGFGDQCRPEDEDCEE